jgi:hypothetical protein
LPFSSHKLSPSQIARLVRLDQLVPTNAFTYQPVRPSNFHPQVTAVVLMSGSLHATTAVTRDAAAPMPASATTCPSAALSHPMPGPKTEAQAGGGGGDGDGALRAGARVRIPKKSLNKMPQVGEEAKKQQGVTSNLFG